MSPRYSRSAYPSTAILDDTVGDPRQEAEVRPSRRGRPADPACGASPWASPGLASLGGRREGRRGPDLKGSAAARARSRRRRRARVAAQGVASTGWAVGARAGGQLRGRAWPGRGRWPGARGAPPRRPPPLRPAASHPLRRCGPGRQGRLPGLGLRAARDGARRCPGVAALAALAGVAGNGACNGTEHANRGPGGLAARAAIPPSSTARRGVASLQVSVEQSHPTDFKV